MTKNKFTTFEGIARQISDLSISGTVEKSELPTAEHPFDNRNIHTELWEYSKKLFDDGHFSQATFEAFKYLDRKVKEKSKIRKSGFSLMMEAFNPDSPKMRIANLSDESGKDEQKGYQFLFAGSIMAIRNPRGHELELGETIEECLDHLSLASMLLRKLE